MSMSKRKPFTLTLGEAPGNEVAFETYGLIVNDQDKIRWIPISLLDDHPDNKYAVRNDQKMAELIQSIGEYGILEPLIVAPSGDRFTVLAGHRRKFAALKNNLSELPCVVKEVSEADQDNILVDTNNQREQTISEKAWGYRLKYDAERRKSGYRSDLTDEEGGSTIDKLSCGSEDSKTQIARLIRITKLNQDLLYLVDEQTIPLHAAEKLSAISESGQEVLAECLKQNEKRKITIEEAEFIRDADKEGTLTAVWIESFLFEAKKEKEALDPEEQKRLKKIERFNKVTKDCFPSDADNYVEPYKREALVTRLVGAWMEEQRSGREDDEDEN